jgi:tRNA(Ile)-lysidine synthase
VNCEHLREAVRESGLLTRGASGRPIVVMLSGGRDSTCLLDVIVALLGAGPVCALHVNYRLREQAEADERHCAELCRELHVELSVLHADPAHAPTAPRVHSTVAGEAAPSAGNLHAWARELRYGEAERLARALETRFPAGARAGGRDALIATGHTRSDQLETILYRLAASPGRRALLGMLPREGRLIRPLLAVSREDTAAYCRERGLRWREDGSNDDERYARARVRAQLVPALRAVHPAAEANVLRTAVLLREETEVFDALVEHELDGSSSIALARLREMPAALARMVVVRLAEEATGAYVPQAGERVQEILALDARGGRAELHVGGGAGAVIDGGRLSMTKLAPRESR